MDRSEWTWNCPIGNEEEERGPPPADFQMLEVYPDPGSCPIIGIRNNGASCFAASVMQLLMHLPRFVLSILQKYPETSQEKAVERFMIRYLAEASLKSGNMDTMSFSSPSLMDDLGFPPLQPSSAEEFYTRLLDVYGGTCVWRAVTTVDIFRIATGIKTPHSYIPAMQTSLTVQRKHSVRESILHFLEPECIDAENPQRTIVTQTQIVSLPSVLCLHLKNMNEICDGYFHIDNNLTLWDANGEKNYELYAIIEHKGPRVRGHYVSIIRKFDSWWICNDSEITELEIGLEEYLMKTYVTGGITVPVMIMYTDVAERDYLFKSDEAGVRLPTIIKYRDEDPTASIIWFDVSTEANYNPKLLAFTGSTMRYKALANQSLSEILAELAGKLEMEDTNLSVWQLGGGYVTKWIDVTNKTGRELSSSQILVLQHDTAFSMRKSRLIFFCELHL